MQATGAGPMKLSIHEAQKPEWTWDTERQSEPVNLDRRKKESVFRERDGLSVVGGGVAIKGVWGWFMHQQSQSRGSVL